MLAATPGWQYRGTGWPWWVVLPAAAVAVWALVRLHRREMASVPGGLARRLLWLRGTALALLVLFFLEPSLTRRISERVLPLVAVVVDQSGSMGVTDESMAPGAKLAEAIGLGWLPAGDRLLKTNLAEQAASDQAIVSAAGADSAVAKALSKLAALSRRDRALQLAQQEVLPALQGKARFKVFGMDTDLAPLDLEQSPRRMPNRATDMERSLTTLTRNWAQEYVGGVILLSDGRQTAGADVAPVIRSLRARGGWVAGIMIGDPGVPPDAVVAEVSGSSEVFLGENVPLTVRYRVSGAGDLEWDLVVTREGQELERRSVRGNGQWQFETFAFAATNAGVSLYQARLDLARAQTAASSLRPTGSVTLDFWSQTNGWKEASVANNAAEFAVAVNQDPIKVLLVDSTPRWESRYLAAMFERDRRVSFTRRYHSVSFEDQSLPLLPRSQVEWDAYDMICLGDLDSNELPPEQQRYAANFVARRGGFLVCLAGPRGMPRAFSLGPFADLLPVRLSLDSSRNPEPVTVDLTPEGADHPIMQVLNDGGYNRKLWPLLPPLQWTAEGVVPKPGATVLLTAQNQARTPIIAVQRFGAGRVLWASTEETWRWRDRLGERVHQTFWLQATRWGLAGRLRGKDPRLQVGLDRYLMTSGETAELRTRAVLENGQPLPEPPLVKLERIDENGKPLAGETRIGEMSPLADAPGLWQYSLKDLAEGAWRITATHPHAELRGLAEVRDLIVRDLNSREGLELGGDLAGLARLASLGGHMAGTMDQAGRIMRDFAERLKPRHQERDETIRLWNSYWSIGVVAAFLCLEWALRKKHGLP